MVSIRVFAPSCMLHGPDTETTKSKCVFITTEREYRGEEQSHEGVLKSGRISFQVISLSALWHLSSEDPLVSLSLCVYRTWSVARFVPRVLLPSQTANCPSPLSRRAAGVRDVCGPERWLGKKQKQKKPR